MNRLTLTIRMLCLGGALLFTGQCLTFVLWKIRPSGSFEEYSPPAPPDYSRRENWAALPDMQDDADTVPPGSGLEDRQDEARVDVFYVHPTTYSGSDSWNAESAAYPLEVYGLRPIKQATVFNGSARVFAPRYRQATLYSFVDRVNGEKALAVAEEDVAAAFEYYLEHYNNGRPYILAGHSQGSLLVYRTMLKQLDRPRPDPRFVVAYLPGTEVEQEKFQHMQPCDSPAAVRCYISWNSKAWGSQPQDFKVAATRYKGGVCVNPLSWHHDTDTVPKTKHIGSVDKHFEKIEHNYVEAKCENESLWVRIPRNDDYESSLDWRNYHIVDYNLFYLDLRKNVQQRIDAYFKRR